MIVQELVQANITQKIKGSHYWPFVGGSGVGSPMADGLPSQRTSDMDLSYTDSG